MAKQKRKRSAEDDAGGGESAPGDGGGGVASHAGAQDGGWKAPGAAGTPILSCRKKGKGKAEETWRDLSYNKMAEIARRLWGRSVKLGRKADLINRIEAHIWVRPRLGREKKKHTPPTPFSPKEIRASKP